MTLMLDDLMATVEQWSYDCKNRGDNPSEIRVQYHRASGEHILALIKDDTILDYMKWE